MDGEISKGTWIGATVLAIVAILGLGFAVYGISRNLVNNSSASFIKTVDSVSMSGFNDFDGTTVSGLQVRQALENYEGQKIAVWVNTSGTQLAITGAAKPGSQKPGITASTLEAILARKEQLGSTAPEFSEGVMYQQRYYINYNALFNGITSGDGGNFKSTTQGYMEYTGDFKLYAGTSDIVFNTVKTNYKDKGCAEYIATGSNFNAKLIKDGTGTIIGLMFSQVY